MSTTTPESFVKDIRENIVFQQILNEETSPDKPLQTIIENCLKRIGYCMLEAQSCFEKLGLEILEVNNGRQLDEQWLNETVDIELTHKTIDTHLSNAEKYAERAGSSINLKSGEIITFSEAQIETVCKTNDNYVSVDGDFILAFIKDDIWLKPSNHPQYTTQSFREKYLKLMEAVTTVYTLCIALLNKYYDIKNLPNNTMNVIPATKNICGKLLIDGSTGKTVTSKPFITESMFNTGK